MRAVVISWGTKKYPDYVSDLHPNKPSRNLGLRRWPVRSIGRTLHGETHNTKPSRDQTIPVLSS